MQHLITGRLTVVSEAAFQGSLHFGQIFTVKNEQNNGKEVFKARILSRYYMSWWAW